jgi:glycosyltransferase involved in cell wall biosynthesis
MITVLMPVHNGERYLGRSIESVLSQSCTDFEFLIIDDGSIDSSADIIRSYKDKRIRFLMNGTNQGLVATLNKGLELARGNYIARMDCDDVSVPARLERQFDFMEKNPEVGVCGTWVRTIGEKGEIWDYPSGSDEIKCSLLFESVLAHPSVMLRGRHFGKGGFRYDGGFPHAEDYALWVRCADAMEFANIPEVLVEYRIHRDQTVRRELQGKVMSADRVRELQLRSLGIRPAPEERELHRALSLFRFRPDKAFVDLADVWLQRIRSSNRTSGTYRDSALAAVLAERWYAVCCAATALGFWVWRRYWASPLADAHRLSRKEIMKFAIKCGLKRGH